MSAHCPASGHIQAPECSLIASSESQGRDIWHDSHGIDAAPSQSVTYDRSARKLLDKCRKAARRTAHLTPPSGYRNARSSPPASRKAAIDGFSEPLVVRLT